MSACLVLGFLFAWAVFRDPAEAISFSAPIVFSIGLVLPIYGHYLYESDASDG